MADNKSAGRISPDAATTAISAGFSAGDQYLDDLRKTAFRRGPKLPGVVRIIAKKIPSAPGWVFDGAEVLTAKGWRAKGRAAAGAIGGALGSAAGGMAAGPVGAAGGSVVGEWAGEEIFDAGSDYYDHHKDQIRGALDGIVDGVSDPYDVNVSRIEKTRLINDRRNAQQRERFGR